MKYLFIAIACCLAVAGSGQMPYNPDSDGDSQIGVPDLLTLLSLFGESFQSVESAVWTCGDVINYHEYSYETVLIGGQCWFAENLQAEFYSNGDSIPNGQNLEFWSTTNSGAQAIFNGDSSLLPTYGRLYNWYASVDVRGLCPSGWHVPSDIDWFILEMELGMTAIEAYSDQWRGSNEGTVLKSATMDTPPWNGINQYGFSGLPGGLMDHTGYAYNFGSSGYFWSSTYLGNDYQYRALTSNLPGVARFGGSPRLGLSVRCVKE